MAMRFEELRVWQRARELACITYDLSRATPFARDRALREQIRRAAVSVMSNIAEGFERRDSQREFCRFLSIARGSCGELRSQLYIASDQKYLDDNTFDAAIRQAIDVSQMLRGLARAARR